jgi:hypothetical protein
MHALWYMLPVIVVSVVVLFIVVGLRYLYKGTPPPLWVQFACIIPFMLFSLRYWYLPIEIAAGMFSGIYDPIHNLFPGMAAKDMIPCTDTAYACSVLSFDYAKHVAWTIGLFDGYTLQAWIPHVLKVHLWYHLGSVSRRRSVGVVPRSGIIGTAQGQGMSIIGGYRQVGDFAGGK